MPLEQIMIPTKRSKAAYIAKRFNKYFQGDVLDVGYDQAHLKMLLSHVSYTNLEIGGEIELKRLDKLPFDNNSFDCVLCSDLLEQLDNFQGMFLELLRVSRRYVLVSLPNSLSNSHFSLAFSSPGPGSFNLCDIVNFMESHAKTHPFKIVEMFATDRPRALLSQMIKKIRTTPTKPDYFSNTLWTVIEISP